MSIIGAIEAIINNQPWVDGALCTQVDEGDMFFPEKGEQSSTAKRICMRCDVREECLKYAMANDERFGVWGGLSARERTKLRRAS